MFSRSRNSHQHTLDSSCYTFFADYSKKIHTLGRHTLGANSSKPSLALYTKSRNPNQNLSPRRNSTQTHVVPRRHTSDYWTEVVCKDRTVVLRWYRARDKCGKPCLPQRGLNEKCTIHPLVDCCCLPFASSLSRTLSLSLSSHKSALLFLCAHVTLVCALILAWLALLCGARGEASVKRRKVPIKFRRMEESSHTNTGLGLARRLLLSWGGFTVSECLCVCFCKWCRFVLLLL